MANNIFKLIKNKAYQSFSKSSSDKHDGSGAEIDAHALIRCSSEEAKSYIPAALAEKLSVLPLAVIELHNRKILTVASPEINPELQQSLKFACGIEIKLIRLEKIVLRKAINLAYHGSDAALVQNMQKLNIISEQTSLEERKSTLSEVRSLNKSSCEINNFIKTILTYAIARKASDIHFLPCIDGMRIKLRIDGELRTHEEAICSLDVYQRIVSRIKSLSKLDITKNDIAHDGSISYQLEDTEVAIRISIMPTIHGEKVVLRLHGIKEFIKLEEIGFDPKTLQMISQVVSGMQGLIICTGATGSGKSTTLYAILETISQLNKSIVTVEDPVEIKLNFASQTSINTKKGFGYSEMLKTALRQDPDCIMIGELRDAESTKIAVQAALTGHLVLTSLHAGSVIEALQRLENVGIERDLIAQTCKLIIHQQLVPQLCSYCKIIDLQTTNQSGFQAYKAAGCIKCDYTGYTGRRVLNESLYFDPQIKNAIQNSKFSNLSKFFSPDNFISISENSNYVLKSGDISANFN